MSNEPHLYLKAHAARWLGTALGSKTLLKLWRQWGPAMPVPAVAYALALKSKRGVTAIEYGLIAALIAVAIIVAVTLVGSNLNLTFNMIAGHLGNSPH
jgi:pilus assembly protein Flp/PilA